MEMLGAVIIVLVVLVKVLVGWWILAVRQQRREWAQLATTGRLAREVQQAINAACQAGVGGVVHLRGDCAFQGWKIEKMEQVPQYSVEDGEMVRRSPMTEVWLWRDLERSSWDRLRGLHRREVMCLQTNSREVSRTRSILVWNGVRIGQASFKREVGRLHTHHWVEVADCPSVQAAVRFMSACVEAA